MIATRGLSKRFGEHEVVQDLDLEIPEGEVFGFLGPNGAGKTTTVRMLTCLIAPTAGAAMVHGYQVGRDDEAIRRHVGLLTEVPGLYDRLSAWRNLTFYGRLYEIEDVARQAEKYLVLLGLWDRRHDTVGSFSKGMRQKLAIARAMLHEPRVLFLDEPTAALDPEAARLVRDFIEELRGEGRTIFICTHNLDEADRLCDRVAVFKQRLRVVDTPQRLRHRVYERRVVFTLVGAALPFLPLVRQLPAVKQIEALDNQLVALVADPEQDNPLIVRALVGAGADVQFVKEQQHSLEDVYLQLIREA